MSTALPAGTMVAGFRVVAPLGEGASGTVYLAEDVVLGREVALKVLSPALARDERFRRRFLDESRLAASLEHPNILPIYAAGDGDGHLHLAMRRISGGDLREILRAEGRLEPGRSLALLEQVASALDAAHARGLVHRDVKPGNILVARGEGGETAYLADFGLATHARSPESLSGAPGLVGTVAYVAPEQIEGGAVGAAADRYSLACCLFECLTGARPFERESDLAVVFAHLHEPPPSARALRPELPGGLDAVLARGMAKDPAGRPPTCRALIAEARAALDPASADVPPPRRRRRLMALAAGAVVVAAAVAVPLAVIGLGGGGGERAVTGSVAALDPASGRVGHDVALGAGAWDVRPGPGGLWGLVGAERRLVAIDPRTGRAGRSIGLGVDPGGFAVGGGALWVSDRRSSTLLRIDPAHGNDVRRITLERPPGAVKAGVIDESDGVAAGSGSIWVAHGLALVDRLDPRTGRLQARIRFLGARTPVTGEGQVWVLAGELGEAARIDPTTNRIVARAHLHPWLAGGAVANGYLWVAIDADGAVWKIDASGRVQGTSRTGAGTGAGMTVTGGAVWVSNGRGGSVSRVDTATGEVRTVAVGPGVGGLSLADGRLWVALDPAPEPERPLAGASVARLVLRDDIIGLDPAINTSPADSQVEYATCAKLMNYPDRSGEAGARPVPELADSPPRVSADGLTWTMRIRPGYRFSPPSDRPVTAQAMAATLERALSPSYGDGSPGIYYLGDIVGARAYHEGRAARVAGIRARGSELSIRLVKPAGDLPTRLALPYFCAVPPGTPAISGGVDAPIPSAGPYYVASKTAGSMLLRRNPGYHGPRPSRVDAISIAFGTAPDAAVAAVQRGEADQYEEFFPFPYTSSLMPGSGLDRRLGSGAAARGQEQRLFRISDLGVRWLALNTRSGIFRDATLRRAVDLAVDRPALAAVWGAEPWDRYLLPELPGGPRAEVAPLDGPDLARARGLARGRGGRAVAKICGQPAAQCQATARLLRRELGAIGIDLRIRLVDTPPTLAAASAHPPDLILSGWGSSDLDPADGLAGPLLGSEFGIPEWLPRGPWRGRLERAARLTGPARERAYARFAVDLQRTATPYVAYAHGTFPEIVSRRVGCVTHVPAYPLLDLAAMCLRG